MAITFPATAREHAAAALPNGLLLTRAADRLANEILDRHCSLIAEAIQQLGHEQISQFEEIIWSGQADFLAGTIAEKVGLQQPFRYLSNLIGAEAARCAPAYSVACLAAET